MVLLLAAAVAAAERAALKGGRTKTALRRQRMFSLQRACRTRDSASAPAIQPLSCLPLSGKDGLAISRRAECRRQQLGDSCAELAWRNAFAARAAVKKTNGANRRVSGGVLTQR
jgi:hypothetical protein